MRYFKIKRAFVSPDSSNIRAFADNDPLTGLANLFDIGLVFIVGLLLTIFSSFHLQDLFDQTSEITIMKQSKDGQMEIITKQGKKIEAVRVTRTQAQGRGVRLGTAYRLKDGSMVYVPEE